MLAPALLSLLYLTYVSSEVPRLAPSFLVEPPVLVQYLASAGVRVRCAARGNPPPDLTWLRGNLTPLENKLGERHIYNGTLEILPSTSHESVTSVGSSSVVRCRARNVHGLALSRDITLQPVLEVQWKAVVRAGGAAEGGVAALWCGAEPDSPLIQPAAWYRGAHLLELDTPTPESRYLLAGAWLLVRGLTASPGDAGPYTCLARHSLSAVTRRSAPVLLHLTTGPPMSALQLGSSARDLSTSPGTDFCLPCANPDHPPPQYTWYRVVDGRLNPAETTPGVWLWADGAALCVRHATSRHSGAWLCKAYNMYGESAAQVEVRVAGSLTVTVGPLVLVASVGSTVQLNCSSSDTEAKLTWFRDGALVGSGGALLLRGVSRTHRGLYQCFARTATEHEHADVELRLGESAPELQYTFIEQVVRGGGHVSLRCTAVADPPPSFLWLLEDQPLGRHQHAHSRYSISEERSVSGEVVSVLNVTSPAGAGAGPGDGGRYTCRAHNRLGAAQHSARIDVYGAPSVRALGPARLLAGDNATLYCPYTGYPISSVVWSRRDVALPTTGRVTARAAELRLWPTLPSDAGLYTCTVTAPGAPPATGTLQIQVRNPPKISPFLFSSELTEGSSAQVLCGVYSGDKPLYFSWLKDGGTLPVDLQIEEKSLNEFSLLVFPALSARYTGDYTCRVSNHAATVNYTATLNVKVPPAWTREPADVSVLAGTPLALQCAAAGHPAPALTWHKRIVSGRDAKDGDHWDPVQSIAGSVRAESASRDLEGEYRCAADNGVGPPLQKHVTITVHEPPRLESGPRNVSAVRGAPAELWCHALGDPPLALRWTHRDAALDTDSYRWSVSETHAPLGLRSVLRLRAASPSDAGEYRCHAHNQYGHADMPLYLHIEEPPSAPAALALVELSSRWARIRWRGSALDHEYTALCTGVHAYGPDALRPAHAHNITMEPTLEHRGDARGYQVMSGRLMGLHPALRYSLRLITANHAGRSQRSEPLLFTTLEEPPDAPPTTLRVKSVGSPGELLLSWFAPALESWNGELIGYLVTWSELYDADAGAVREEHGGSASIRGATVTELVLRGLRGGLRHSISVRAYSRAGVGPAAPLLYATPHEGVPEDPPEAVSCEALGVHALRVSWSPPTRVPARGSRGYHVRVIPVYTCKSTHEHQNVIPDLEESVMSDELIVRGLRAATNYSVWVSSRGELGTGPPATPVYCTTLEDVPGAVREVRAVPVAANAVLVTWTAPAPCTGRLTHYTLYTREFGKAGNEWSQIVNLKEGALSVGAQREVRSLREHVLYKFWVVAATAAGAGPPSHPVTATPAHLSSARVTWSERRTVAVAGARVLLRCSGAGSPPLRWRWTAPPTAPPAVRLLSLSDAPELLLHKVEVSWSGNYTCSVRNAVGSDSAYLLLLVLGPPPRPVLRLLRADPHALHIGWDAPPGSAASAPVLKYSVRWTLITSGEGQQEDGKERVVPAGDTTMLVSRLRCGALYSVTMQAHSALTASPHAATLSARTAGDRALALSGKEAVWTNSTALRVNLLGWERRCSVEQWLIELRTSGAAVWSALRIDAYSAQAGNLLPATWYEVRVTAESTAGKTVALYRVATLTLGGERIGETIEVSTEERRTTVEGRTRIGTGSSAGAEAEAGGAWHSRLLLVSALVAGCLTVLLVALTGTALVRRRSVRHDHSTLRLPHLQLYTMEPSKRNGKTISEPDGELHDISPYATFSMTGAAECVLHLQSLPREYPALSAAPHRARTRTHLVQSVDTDSESSESPCATCSDQLYRLRHATPESSTEDTSQCAPPSTGGSACHPTVGRHGSAPAARYSVSPAVQAHVPHPALRTPPSPRSERRRD